MWNRSRIILIIASILTFLLMGCGNDEGTVENNKIMVNRVDNNVLTDNLQDLGGLSSGDELETHVFDNAFYDSDSYNNEGGVTIANSGEKLSTSNGENATDKTNSTGQILIEKIDGTTQNVALNGNDQDTTGKGVLRSFIDKVVSAISGDRLTEALVYSVNRNETGESENELDAEKIHNMFKNSTADITEKNISDDGEKLENNHSEKRLADNESDRKIADNESDKKLYNNGSNRSLDNVEGDMKKNSHHGDLDNEAPDGTEMRNKGEVRENFSSIGELKNFGELKKKDDSSEEDKEEETVQTSKIDTTVGEEKQDNTKEGTKNEEVNTEATKTEETKSDNENTEVKKTEDNNTEESSKVDTQKEANAEENKNENASADSKEENSDAKKSEENDLTKSESKEEDTGKQQ